MRRNKVCFVGYGSTEYSRKSEESQLGHYATAIRAALNQTGLKKKDIHGLSITTQASPDTAPHVAEQLGFRKIVDTTFMIGHLVTERADLQDVERYFKALRRAQQDIDLEPESYKHYFLRELPERYHRMVDARMFGPGERIVFEAYPKEIFERTRRWIESWNLFPPEQAGRAGYDASVV